MLKRSITLAAIAISFLLAPVAQAGQTTTFIAGVADSERLTSDVVGTPVYEARTADGGQKDEKIGQISNLILDEEGKVSGVVIDIGGALGVGERNVAVTYAALTFHETEKGRRAVIDAGVELDDAPEFTGPDGAIQVSNLQAIALDAREAATGEFDRSRLAVLPHEAMQDIDLVGARVYTMNDEWIGEVSEVIAWGENGVDAVVIDFGGFLGVGEKPIAVAADSLTVASEVDQKDAYFVFTSLSREELEAAPAYDPDTYEKERERMRIAPE